MSKDALETWLDSLSDADLREIAEAGEEATRPLLVAVSSSETAGRFQCPRCQGDGSWERIGQQWSAECHLCGWNAAGMLHARIGIT